MKIMRRAQWMFLALAAVGCATEELPVSLGAGGTPVGTGGVVIASGGTPVTTGGTVTATGGIVATTGGTVTATGGAVATTGGTTATGGTVTATGGAVATTGGTVTATGGDPLGELFPPPSTDRTPSPDNPPECPDVAPDNPVGDCAGLPIYLGCSYGTYNCICDWYHWLCFG